MRRRIEIAALAALLSYGGIAVGQAVLGKDEKPTNPPADKPAKTVEQMSLDELLALALKNNPDLRVADAKVHKAEAELNRVRLQVTQKLVTLRNSIQAAQATAGEAQSRFYRVSQLLVTKQASQEEYDAAEATLARYKAEVATLQAELKYVVGKSTPETGKESEHDAQERAAAAGLRWLAAQDRKGPSVTDAEKLRKALDKPINVQFKMSKLQEVLAFLRDGHGVTFLDSTNLESLSKRVATVGGQDPKAPEITLELKDTSLGAILQALQDVTPGLRFTVRDYGILVTYYGELPADALSVHDFLKSDAGKQKPKEDAAKQETSTHNYPSGKVDGKVKKVDDGGLILIDLGSDDGLEKGHNLEVFRLDPQPRYLGTLRIVEVRSKEAVGKTVRKPNEAIKEGDRVSNQVFLK
jgi:multidrug efflux pump subunit AcrA (membrane-fusion protein)